MSAGCVIRQLFVSVISNVCDVEFCLQVEKKSSLLLYYQAVILLSSLLSKQETVCEHAWHINFIRP